MEDINDLTMEEINKILEDTSIWVNSLDVWVETQMIEELPSEMRNKYDNYEDELFNKD